jgi:hypothetical protein
VNPEKEKLVAIYKLVHPILRMLKMGETGTILCSREHAIEDVRSYVMMYAFHKGKWFKLKHDRSSNVLYALRAPPPPWEKPPEDSEPEEL